MIARTITVRVHANYIRAERCGIGRYLQNDYLMRWGWLQENRPSTSNTPRSSKGAPKGWKLTVLIPLF